MSSIVSMPADVDRGFAADLVDLFGTLDPRSLLMGLPAFVLVSGDADLTSLRGQVPVRAAAELLARLRSLEG